MAAKNRGIDILLHCSKTTTHHAPKQGSRELSKIQLRAKKWPAKMLIQEKLTIVQKIRHFGLEMDQKRRKSQGRLDRFLLSLVLFIMVTPYTAKLVYE